MRLALTADLHGHLPTVPPCDALIIAGDILPAWMPSLPKPAHIARAYDWLRYEFYPWIQGLDVPVYATLGNHDAIWMPRFESAARADTFASAPTNLRILVDEAIEIGGVKAWFTPWTPTFFYWSFMDDEDGLARRFAAIPDDTEIIVSHGPPRGCCDLIPGSFGFSGERVGSTALLDRCCQLPDLQLLVCGHIHCAHGYGQIHKDGLMCEVYNVSLVDEGYRPVNPIVMYELTP